MITRASMIFMALPLLGYLSSSGIQFSDESAISFWLIFRGWPASEVFPMVLALVCVLPISRKIRSGYFEKKVYRSGYLFSSLKEIGASVARGWIVGIGSFVIFVCGYWFLSEPYNMLAPGVTRSLNGSGLVGICGFETPHTFAAIALSLGVYIAQMLAHTALWIALCSTATIVSRGSLIALVVPYFLLSGIGAAFRLPVSFAHSFYIDSCDPYHVGPSPSLVSLGIYWPMEAMSLVGLWIWLMVSIKQQKLAIR